MKESKTRAGRDVCTPTFTTAKVSIGRWMDKQNALRT